MSETVSEELLTHLISISFLAAVPASRILWNRIEEHLINLSSSIPGKRLADLVLDASIGNPDFQRFPRDNEYGITITKLFKHIWKRHKWDGHKMFNFPENITGTATLAYKTYYGTESNQPVTLLESLEGISNGTTGLNSWGASKVLAYWCLDNQNIFQRKRILELGSGIGFTAATILGNNTKESLPKQYIATDCHPHVLSILHHNLCLLRDRQKERLPSLEELLDFVTKMTEHMQTEKIQPGNFLHWTQKETILLEETEVLIKQLDWRYPPEDIPTVDVILGSDVVYSCALLPHLAQLIRSILEKSTNIVEHREEDIQVNGASTQDNAASVHKKDSECEHSTRADVLCDPDGKCLLLNQVTLPVAYIACTRRTSETLNEFTRQLTKAKLDYKIVYQTTLSREEALLCYDESYLPIKIYKIWFKIS